MPAGIASAQTADQATGITSRRNLHTTAAPVRCSSDRATRHGRLPGCVPLSPYASGRIARARPCLFLHNPNDCACDLRRSGVGGRQSAATSRFPAALYPCNPQRPSEERGGPGSQPHARRSPHPHSHGGVRAGQAKANPPTAPNHSPSRPLPGIGPSRALALGSDQRVRRQARREPGPPHAAHPRQSLRRWVGQRRARRRHRGVGTPRAVQGTPPTGGICAAAD